MASSGKKRNKHNWKPAVQNDFIQIAGVRSTNWADEVENEAEDVYDVKLPVVLPTAPRASCMVPVDESKVPSNAPFLAHVSNLPYELTENELMDLFPELIVKEARIPKEERGNRAKGFGYVEFEDRGSLLNALRMGETYVKGRTVRIELATSDSGRGGGRSRGMQRSDMGSMNSSEDRTSGNWRSGPREESENRSYERGGPRREYGVGGGGGGGGGFSRRENQSDFDRRGDSREDRFRREDRGFSRDDRGPPRDSDRRYMTRREDPPPEKRGVDSGRPKLNMQPRSTNLPPPSISTEQVASTSIFGSAKPVDTSAKLLEIEERLAKSEIGEKSRTGSGSSSSGGLARSASDAKERKPEPAPAPRENAWKSRSVLANNRTPPSEASEPRADDKKGNSADGEDDI